MFRANIKWRTDVAPFLKPESDVRFGDFKEAKFYIDKSSDLPYFEIGKVIKTKDGSVVYETENILDYEYY